MSTVGYIDLRRARPRHPLPNQWFLCIPLPHPVRHPWETGPGSPSSTTDARRHSRGRPYAPAFRRGAEETRRLRRDRHRGPRLHRHARTAPGKAVRRTLLPRRRPRPRHRGLQLPARGRHRHEHRRRLRHVVLGAGLRRLRAARRPRHPAPHPVGPGHRARPRRPGLARRHPGRRLPAPDPAPPAGPPRRARLDRLRGNRTGVHGLPRHLRGRLVTRLPGPDPGQPVQRRLLRPRHRTASSPCCAASATRWARPG
ncbi:hypothetical protein SUDANB96_05851 [Streptomyces sp. enrichment culture]